MQLFRTFLIAACLPFSAFCQTYTIHTVAVGGLPENTPGVNASLGQVLGIAVDSKGNVFIPLIQYAVVLRLDAATAIGQ